MKRKDVVTLVDKYLKEVSATGYEDVGENILISAGYDGEVIINAEVAEDIVNMFLVCIESIGSGNKTEGVL